MNHGGITVQTDLRYREDESRPISLNVVDNRNGTYGLSFVPERAGVMSLMVSVDGKLIEVRVLFRRVAGAVKWLVYD